MDTQDKYEQAIVEGEEGIQNLILRHYVSAYMSLALTLTLLAAAISLWYFKATLALEPIMHWAAFANIIVLLLLSCMVTMQSNTTIAILKQTSLYQLLRIDLFTAVDSNMRHHLGKYLSGYKQTRTQLTIGEELLQDTTQLSQRRLKYERALSEKMADADMAQAVTQLVFESNQHHQLRSKNEALERVHNALSGDNLVNFSKPE